MIAYTPEPRDVLSAFRLGARPRSRQVAISVVWVALGAALLFSQIGPLSPTALIAGCVGGFVGAWLVSRVRRLLVPRWARRHFEQQSAMRGTWEVAWSDAGLTMVTTRGQAVHPWTDYRWRRESDEAILLYLTDAQYQFIPRRILTQDAQVELRPLLDRVPPDRLAPAWLT